MNLTYGLVTTLINIYIAFVCVKMVILNPSAMTMAFLVGNLIALGTGIVFYFMPTIDNIVLVYLGRYSDRISMGIGFTMLFWKLKYSNQNFFSKSH